MADPRRIRVLVDLFRVRPGGEIGGIKPALFEMLRYLCTRPEVAFEMVYAVDPASRPESLPPLRPVDRRVPTTLPATDLAARELCDVVYCPFGVTDFACPGIPTITLIADLLHRDFPATLTPDDRAYREHFLTDAVARSDWLQVISDYTRGRLIECLGAPSERIFRTYLPAHRRLPRAPSPVSPRATAPFFFYPANAWAHKNHVTLLRAYARYRRGAGAKAWRLILTGHDDERMRRVRALATELRLEEPVTFAGFVSEQQLAGLWTEAGALIFPSLHEGFGLPLLEAMGHGVPIVAHRGTAVPEVVGGAALLVDARDPGQLAEAMDRIANDAILRATLAERGRKRLGEFSPDNDFAPLGRRLQESAAGESRWRHTGYHPADGLTDPVAMFALPRIPGPLEMRIGLRPLPAPRTLQAWCGPDLIETWSIAAFSPARCGKTFLPRARTLTFRVPGANRLCEADPRTHGVLLDSLHVRDGHGVGHDLLADPGDGRV